MPIRRPRLRQPSAQAAITAACSAPHTAGAEPAGGSAASGARGAPENQRERSALAPGSSGAKKPAAGATAAAPATVKNSAVRPPQSAPVSTRPPSASANWM